jgi:hypothetical protein
MFCIKTHNYVLNIDIPTLLIILKLANVLNLKLLRNSVRIGIDGLLSLILQIHCQVILLEHTIRLLSTIVHGVVGSVVENVRVVKIKLLFCL